MADRAIKSADMGIYAQVAGIYNYTGVNFGPTGINGMSVAYGVQASGILAGYAQVGGTISIDYDLFDTNLNPFSNNYDFPFIDVALSGNIGLGIATPTGTPVFAAGVYNSPFNGEVTATAGVGVSDLAEVGLSVSSKAGYVYDFKTREWIHVDDLRQANAARADAVARLSPEARQERNASAARADAASRNSLEARDERTLSPTTSPRTSSFREAELASLKALKELEDGMTGGKLPGKDQDDRDMAKPSPRSPAVDPRAADRAGSSPTNRSPSESAQAEKTRRDVEKLSISRNPFDTMRNRDRDSSRGAPASDGGSRSSGNSSNSKSGGSSGNTKSPNSSGSPDDRQDRSNSKSTKDPTKDHRSGGHATAPVLLDMAGNGITVDTISTSSQFLDLAGDGYQHRTAWAGKGTGVLVIDADGDGKISRSSEFVFTEWDATATGDLAAIKSVFDTNGNGKLDAGDARWNDFKVMVDGQLVTLASLGIVSIDLTPTGSGQRFDDGSAVTGTTTFTKSDGSTGTVGDAVLVSDANGYVIKRATTNNADGSTTVAIDGYDKEGQIAFRNSILTSADGLTKTTKFDDDGNGTWDRSQVETLRQAAPIQADPPPPVLYIPPVGPNDIVATAAGGPLDGTAGNDVMRGGDGDDFFYGGDGDDFIIGSDADNDQVVFDGAAADYSFVQNANGSVSVTHATRGTDTLVGIRGYWFEGEGRWYSKNDLVQGVFGETASVGTGNLSYFDGGAYRDTANFTGGTGTFDGQGGIDTAVFSGDVTEYRIQGVGPYLKITKLATGEWMQIKNVEYLKFSSGPALSVADILSASGHQMGDYWAQPELVDRTRTRTISNYAADGALLNRTTIITSADRKTVTTYVDQDGDGITDQKQIYVKNADGSSTTTVTQYALNGAVLRKIETTSSADGLTEIVRTDSTGSGTYELVETESTVVAGNGTRTKTTEARSANNTLISKEVETTSADGRTKTTQIDDNGNGQFETRIESVVTTDVAGATVTTVTTYNADNTVRGSSVTTKSANGLSTVEATDLDGKGATDITSSDVTVVAGDGTRTQTVQDTANNGTLLGKTVRVTSADAKSITITNDANGDGATDSTKTILVDIAGATTATTSLFNANGTLKSRLLEQSDAAGLSITTKSDLNGDGTYDLTVTDVTVTNADLSRTRTVRTLSSNNTLLGSTATTTTADSLNRTVREDINGDGTIDKTTASVMVLNADGSRKETTTVTSGNSTLLGKSEELISADRKTTTVTTDANGDTKTDRTEVSVVNADGSKKLTVTDFNPNATVRSKSETNVSANGLTTTVKDDINGDGVFDGSTQIQTVINADAGRTTTTSELAGNGTLLSRTVATVSANGFSSETQVDANGDGTIERKITDTTIFNADSSKTQTVSELSGTGALIGKTTTTTSANGLSTTTLEDLDGNGTNDRTTVSTTTLAANGARTNSVLVKNGNGQLVSETVATTSADKRLVTTTVDLNNDGIVDDKSTAVLGDDGSTRQTVQTFSPTGALTSSSLSIVSADGLSKTLVADLNGDGITDRSLKAVTTLNVDGSKTEVADEYNGDGTVKNRITTAVSGNGLTKSITWAASGTTTSRSMTDTTVINANGSTTQTVAYKKANGTLESQTVKTASADQMTSTITRDIDGNGTVDLTVTSAKQQNGSLITTSSGTRSTSLGTRKVATVTADGLSTTTDYMANTTPTSGIEYTAQRDTNVTTLNADASEVEVSESIKYSTAGAVISREKSRTTTSGNGLSVTKEWDFAGDGVYERTQTDVTVLGSDGSETQTLSEYDSGVLKKQYVTTTSANGLHVATSWDIFGADALSQDATDVIAINADGTKTRTVTNLKGDGSQLSKYVTVTSADGRTTTVQEDVDGTVGVDRTKTTTRLTLADDSVVETLQTKSAANVLQDKETTTTSGDGRTTSIVRDIDGDATTDQTETSTKFVDGTSKTVITNLGTTGGKASETTVAVSADGLVTTSEWDFDGNGTIDQRRITTQTLYGDGSRQTVANDTNVTTGLLQSTITTFVSADGRLTTINNNMDGAGAVDRIETLATDISGGVTRKTRNATTVARDIARLLPGEVYWKQATAYNLVSTTSADGLSVTTLADYDGNAGDVSTATFDLTKFEYSAVSQTQIDGSVVTNITEKNAANAIIAKGIVSVSADGRTSTLRKDGDNNGTYEHLETATTQIDGSIVHTVADLDAAGKATKSVINGVNAMGSLAYTLTADKAAATLTLTGSLKLEDLSFSWSGTDLQISVAAVANFTANSIVATLGGNLTKVVVGGVTSNLLVAPAAGATVTGPSTATIIHGVNGNETLKGGAAADTIYGGSGNDSLFGDLGNDVLSGGMGTDYLAGGEGDDRYVYRRGDGADSIDDFKLMALVSGDTAAANALGVNSGGIVNTWVGGYRWDTATSTLQKRTGAGNETVSFEGGIKAEDIRFTWVGETAVATFSGGVPGDSLSLIQHGGEGHIDYMSFASSPTLRFAVATGLGATLVGTAESEYLFGLSGNERLEGGDGDDRIFGDAGNDTLIGGNGIDTLIGGTGDDYLNGQAGNDIYVYRRGDGADTIDDYSLTTVTSADISAANALGVKAGGIVNTWLSAYRWDTASNQLQKRYGAGDETVQFGSEISVGDLRFAWDGQDLVATFRSGPSNDSIRFVQQNQNGYINFLSFGGGTALDFSVALAPNTTRTGTALNEYLFGLAGNERLEGGAGNDTLSGGLGNDTLVGGTGADKYVFGLGDGADTIVESGVAGEQDELVFGSGIDANELWFRKVGNDLVINVLGTDDQVTVQQWFSAPTTHTIEKIRSGDGQVLNYAKVDSLIAAMAGFQPATGVASGVNANDLNLSDPGPLGTVAAAVRTNWMAA